MKNPVESVDSLFLLVGVSLLPVYVFGSGGVQPAHLLLAVFFFLRMVVSGIPMTSWTLVLLGVFLYSLFVEIFYVLLGADPSEIINSIFFLYNFFLVVSVFSYVRERGLSNLLLGVLIAGGIVLATVLADGVSFHSVAESGRSTGSFNNPNQLGYFSVCFLSLAYLFYRHHNIGYWTAFFLFSLSLFMSISSLSKAAMLANLFVILFAMKPVSSRSNLAFWFGGALFAVVVLFYLYQTGAFDNLIFFDRIENMMNESDSSLESRGYFAFRDGSFLQIFFGLGSQRVGEIVGHEVHSTLGGMLNNYGLIGFSLFSLVLAIWATRLWKAYGLIGLICLAGPAMLYGITHNGTRFTAFWLLFAASMAMASRCAKGPGMPEEQTHSAMCYRVQSAGQ